ncbi:hypothetical protein SUBVAR_07331 [Subdoligranulum variabile DSM 15176]|uniref:Uncharacterized protein n=1 Tax=Subdoligranulum variabile DSM 15176 TaxID=411471 RepID=D1PSE7_9FIRM|nr:hypothetical protein SUBVAR_07331 [Subdoligranulum variabile DSM 15176]
MRHDAVLLCGWFVPIVPQRRAGINRVLRKNQSGVRMTAGPALVGIGK